MAAQMVTPEAINFMRKEAGGLICVPMIGAPARRAAHSADGRAKTPPCTKRRSPFRSKRAAVRPPASRRTTAPRRFKRCSIRSASRPISCGPGTRFRCARATAACWCAPGRPKRRSISRGWRVCIRPASSAKSWPKTARWSGSTAHAQFADRHGLKLITVKDLIAYRMRTEKLRAARSRSSSCRRRSATGRGVAYETTHRRQHARRAGDGRHRRRQGRARARALRMSDRRRAAFAALRLRRAARRRDARSSPKKGAASSCTCVRKAAASALPTSCAPTNCRIAAPTRSRRTSRSGCPSTSATTASARRSWPISA